MTKDLESLPSSRPLPQIYHLKGNAFAALLASGELRLTSIGAENCYAVDIEGREFYAKDVPASCT